MKLQTIAAAIAAVLGAPVLAAGVLPAGAGAGTAEHTSCTLGEAQANFEAPIHHFEADDVSVRFDCQYRLFFGGRTFTYCEDDHVLGALVVNSEYVNRGWTREQGIADIQARQPTALFLDGIAQTLMRTAYKDGIHATRGHLVYQQVGFITKLTPGTHSSVLIAPTATFTVTLNVLPRTNAAC